MKKIAVVILNWNGKKWLEKFLTNIEQCSNPLADVVIIDNGSIDDSLSYCTAHHPNVQWIGLSKNLGFAGGYNEGLKKINNPYLLLLNSDVEVTPNWLEPMLNWMESDKEIAAVQPKIIDYQTKKRFEYAGGAGGYIDRDGYAFCAGRIFYQFEDDLGQYKGNQEVFWATGAALMIRNSAWNEVNGFDADFFAHMEEIDLCWRLKNRGYKIGACLESTVYHVGGDTLDRQNPKKTFLNFRNNLFLITKNYRHSNLTLKILKRLLMDGLAGIRFLSEGKLNHLWAIVRGHFAFYGMLNNMLRKRALESNQIKNINNKGLFKDSIVYAFFIGGKTEWNTLRKDRFV